jgi:hypothetical protein
MYRDPVSWKEHFERSHAKQLGALMDMLGDAFVEYASGLGTKSDHF